MKKIILVDGNNLVFRSYYATAAMGNLMTNSKGFPTNALYGLINMLNKIIEEEKPNYMAVAFDIGKNFRHEKYENYKAGRSKTPDELLIQLKKCKELLEAMGIKYIALENYEADDIIGTLSKIAYDHPEFEALIVSSDKDLLQLINKQVEVKLLKSKDYVRYNESKFIEDYGIEPIKMIDLKAIMGDPSDNVPGVKGIGEKGALKLLKEYGSLEGIYENIHLIKGATHDKLINDKELAFFSKEICTICLEAPIKEELEEFKYLGEQTQELVRIYEELEFYSLLKKYNLKKEQTKLKYKLLENVSQLDSTKNISYYIECDNKNYHYANILGMGLYDGTNLYYVKPELIKEVLNIYKDRENYTYDLKKNMCILNNPNLNYTYDLMIGAYLLNYQLKDDLAVLMNKEGINTPFYSDILKDDNLLIDSVIAKAKYIYDTKDKIIQELTKENMLNLFNEVEMKLVKVLAKMELNGIKCDINILNEIQEEITKEIKEKEQKIYEICGEEFNINSTKQLGEVLYEHLNIPTKKKKGTNLRYAYSTDATAITKACNYRPELKIILEYRNLTKINNTYLEGLKPYIMNDNKIHTIYKQTQTRTGRLSSVEPNMQNIPTRNEEGRQIKKAFLPENDLFLSTDYSQIELRILADRAESQILIDAFNTDKDIHKQVASDIFKISIEEVTNHQRSLAKAVVFGMVYGMSGFGLGENLQISVKEAKEYIEQFHQLYPGVKEYMDKQINDAKINGYVTTLFNRKREIPELKNNNYLIRQSGERMAMNTPIQGTAADILKMAMIKIDNELEKRNLKSKILLQVHDELIFDVDINEKEILANIVKECMENIVNLKVKLKISLDFGKDWYETK